MEDNAHAAELLKSGEGAAKEEAARHKLEIDKEIKALKELIDALTTTVSGKAPTSHGNHVPATETANNARFLRNDNTWQTVTPAGIGLKTEIWTFTLEDGSTVTKAVYVG